MKVRSYHHSTNLPEICPLCNKCFKMYWKDKEEKNGFSDTTSIQDVSEFIDKAIRLIKD